MRTPTLALLLSSILSLTTAQTQSADGLIVPFTSQLPECASLCGKLFDVQGLCAPTSLTSTSKSCFCTDTRLTPIANTGTAGVSQVCGAQSCTAPADLEKIQTWYEGYCGVKDTAPSSTSASASATNTGAAATSSSASSVHNQAPQGWLQSHYPWLIMIIVLVVAFIGGWILASILRKRYLRKKEREYELRPPVAWGPHQSQGATGGYSSDAVNQQKTGPQPRVALMTPANGSLEKAPPTKKSGWLRKNRS